VQAQARARRRGALLPHLAPHGRHVGIVVKLRAGRGGAGSAGEQAEQVLSARGGVVVQAGRLGRQRAHCGEGRLLPLHPSHAHLRQVSHGRDLARVPSKHIAGILAQLPEQQSRRQAALRAAAAALLAAAAAVRLERRGHRLGHAARGRVARERRVRARVRAAHGRAALDGARVGQRAHELRAAAG
jgi:hypothetical protein